MQRLLPLRPIEISVHPSLYRIGDLGVAAGGCLEVAEAGVGGRVAHPRHDLAQRRPGRRRSGAGVVAEVVETDRLVEAGLSQCPLPVGGEVAVEERAALDGREHERVSVVHVLVEVGGQHLGDPTRHDDRPVRSARLRRPERWALALDERQGLVDPKRPVFEVDVATRQTRQLAVAEARGRADPHQCSEPGLDRVGGPADIVPVEDRALH